MLVGCSPYRSSCDACSAAALARFQASGQLLVLPHLPEPFQDFEGISQSAFLSAKRCRH
ncbi:hypothetical protein FIBSPDRAFT_158757 [Athelia psychrophila]|uniref:Uncharacterized protein n=1 Tax=Athelia psychrophila TaxID=1759441 RepID=A0A166B8X6_9AGAM|nr:hypothetical protein FIBSPDRAFT_158757 [Fibularhizoctonia sp. CBS 109695]